MNEFKGRRNGISITMQKTPLRGDQGRRGGRRWQKLISTSTTSIGGSCQDQYVSGDQRGRTMKKTIYWAREGSSGV